MKVEINKSELVSFNQMRLNYLYMDELDYDPIERYRPVICVPVYGLSGRRILVSVGGEAYPDFEDRDTPRFRILSSGYKAVLIQE